MRLALLSLALVALAACARSAEGEYPRLVPISTLIAPEGPVMPADTDTGLTARAAALRTRADSLRDPVIPPGDLPATAAP